MWLIDVNHYKETLERFKEKLLEFEKPEAVECVKTIIKGLKLEPKVDAVPVVRCKDCIHWYEPEGVCLKIYSDGAVSPYAWQYRNPDDFCSYGERKTDENDKN